MAREKKFEDGTPHDRSDGKPTGGERGQRAEGPSCGFFRRLVGAFLNGGGGRFEKASEGSN